jgi:hypothetical protein
MDRSSATSSQKSLGGNDLIDIDGARLRVPAPKIIVRREGSLTLYALGIGAGQTQKKGSGRSQHVYENAGEGFRSVAARSVSCPTLAMVFRRM